MAPNISKYFWNSATIIFDTSAICKMYDMTESTKSTMVQILSHISNKIWIPGHGIVEDERNRKKVIRNPIRESYKIPDYFDDCILKAKGRELVKKLGNESYYHPFISKNSHQEITKKLEEAIRDLSFIKDKITDEFKLRIEEINQIVDNDKIYEKIKILPHGEEYTYDTMTELCREGEFRYRNLIPPGYLDFAAKKGFSKYGDLFVWKQLLDHANDKHCNVLFVINDNKPDWWEDCNKYKFREELLKEFSDTTGMEIKVCSLEGFVSLLEDIYKDENALQFYHGLEAVKDVLEYTTKAKSHDNNFVDIKCDCCGKTHSYRLDDLVWDWYECGWSEREMGTETQFESTDILSFEECNEDIVLKFTLTEYPAGTIEDIDIEVEGGKITNEPNFMRVLPLPFSNDAEQCLYCGRWTHCLVNDMCEECLDEFNYKINHD